MFKQCRVVTRLPKTRSGKTLRGTMRRIADGQEYTIPPTIDDPVILDEIIQALTSRPEQLRLLNLPWRADRQERSLGVLRRLAVEAPGAWVGEENRDARERVEHVSELGALGGFRWSSLGLERWGTLVSLHRRPRDVPLRSFDTCAERVWRDVGLSWVPWAGSAGRPWVWNGGAPW
ncbi:MAG: hypothetical protein ACRDZ4_01545 [Egibacteraceae bacterium]